MVSEWNYSFIFRHIHYFIKFAPTSKETLGAARERLFIAGPGGPRHFWFSSSSPNKGPIHTWDTR
jgi:hypothetical protein